MPCTDGGPWPENNRGIDLTGLSVDRKTLREYQEKIDYLTDLLCSLCKAVEKNGVVASSFVFPPKVVAWWEKHQAKDAEKKNRVKEALRIHRLKKKALAKLSAEEKAVLGLKTPNKGE